jgi:glycosyltransferase involved in cell wall biosynthesis
MIKVLMLVNWKVRYCNQVPDDLQPPDYVCKGRSYWFFRYMRSDWDVDVVDVRSLPVLESFEKNKLRFYVLQTLRVLPRLGKYDLVLSHGMQAGIVLALWRMLFHTKAKHVVFDIGSFNSAAQEGRALRLMQWASHSIDGVIYHTKSQIEYYRMYYPWLVEKSRFIPFGTDLEFFEKDKKLFNNERYIVCVGTAKRDWDTLVEAYRELNTDVRLKIVGHVDEQYAGISGVDMVPSVPVLEYKQIVMGALFCVLPLESWNYSYGQMTFMQQMAMGKCVVAARVPPLVDYAVDGKTAIFYQPQDVEDCRMKLSLVLGDVDLRERIGLYAPKWLAEHRNEKKMADGIQAFLDEVGGGTGNPYQTMRLGGLRVHP